MHMELLDNLKYTENHEWVLIDGNIATIGVTDYAQRELGDIVFVDIDSIGSILNQDDIFGSIEAVKTVSDLFMPISGEVTEMNQSLETVLGPIVIVQAESRVPVYLRKIDRPGSVEQSAIVVVWVSALVVMPSVPKLKASAINSKFVFVLIPQVPLSSPVAISFNRRSLT